MNAMLTEILAIGDELISGQRLDTNSQWLSQQLSDLGIEPCFHTTVGDDLDKLASALETATHRTRLVITTGGIGPTQDDLTRQAIAQVAQVDLVYHAEIEAHIREIFAGYGRPMPENNRIQAYLPAGSRAIPNLEGTAPGIDVAIRQTRLFALPGVPYEARKMWEDYVCPEVVRLLDFPKTIRHHVIHCFGAGESQIEMLLPGMTDRNHCPRVGITASQATISLRITAAAENEQQCQELIEPTARKISELLGDLVLGENGVSLEGVVVRQLQQLDMTVGILDCGFGGSTGLALFQADPQRQAVRLSLSCPDRENPITNTNISQRTIEFRQKQGLDIGIIVGPIRHLPTEIEPLFDLAISDAQRTEIITLRHGGHSGLREVRTTKQILNQIRLFLRSKLISIRS